MPYIKKVGLLLCRRGAEMLPGPDDDESRRLDRHHPSSLHHIWSIIIKVEQLREPRHFHSARLSLSFSLSPIMLLDYLLDYVQYIYRYLRIELVFLQICFLFLVSRFRCDFSDASLNKSWTFFVFPIHPHHHHFYVSDKNWTNNVYRVWE